MTSRSRPTSAREHQFADNAFLDILYGSKKERDKLVQQGKISSELSAQIDSQYADTSYDTFGNQRDKGAAFKGMSDEQLMNTVLGR